MKLINLIKNINFNLNLQEHPYFLVTPSIIPTLTSISALFFVTEIVNFFYFFSKPYVLILSFLSNKIKNIKFFIFNKIITPVYYFDIPSLHLAWMLITIVSVLSGIYSGEYSEPDLGDYIGAERGSARIFYMHEKGWSTTLDNEPGSVFLYKELDEFKDLPLRWDVHSRFLHSYESDREGFKEAWKSYIEFSPTKNLTKQNFRVFLIVHPEFKSVFDPVWLKNGEV